MKKYRLAKFVQSRGNSPLQGMCRSSLMQNYIIQNNSNYCQNPQITAAVHYFKKQLPELFCKKRVLKNFAKFTGIQASRPATLLKKASSIGAFL